MGEKRYKQEFKNLGKRIKKIRKEKKLVQTHIEVRSGISRADISKIENGLKNVELLTIIKIAEALDIELSELFR